MFLVSVRFPRRASVLRDILLENTEDAFFASSRLLADGGGERRFEVCFGIKCLFENERKNRFEKKKKKKKKTPPPPPTTRRNECARADERDRATTSRVEEERRPAMWGGNANNTTSNANNAGNSQWNQNSSPFGNQNNHHQQQQQQQHNGSPFGNVAATTTVGGTGFGTSRASPFGSAGGNVNATNSSNPLGGFNQQPQPQPQPQQQQQQQQQGIGFNTSSSPFGLNATPTNTNANIPFSSGGGNSTGFGSMSNAQPQQQQQAFSAFGNTGTTLVPSSPFGGGGGGFGTTAGGHGASNAQNTSNNSPFGNVGTTTATITTTTFGGGSGSTFGSTFGGGSGGANANTTTTNNNSPFGGAPSSAPANTSNAFGNGGSVANTSGIFGAPVAKSQQNLNANASPFAPASMSSPLAQPQMSSSPFSLFGAGNTSVRTQGEEKKEEQKQNQSTFGAGIMGGGSGGFTTSGLKIPAPRTQIGAGAGIAPTATATHSFSPLSDGGVKASALPSPKTGPFSGIQGSSPFTPTTAPKQQMATAAVEDFGDDLHKATSKKHITGTCNEMCPISELQRRSEEGDLELFERVDGTNRNKTSVDLCCKKYTRIVDGVQPDMVRTKYGLAKTMSHLWHILDERPEAFVVKSKFLWDRLRSVRQDLSLQQMYDAFAASALQQMVRYAIISEHELCEDAATAISPDGHNSHLNVEQLTKTLTTLRHIYDDHRAKQQALPLDHEAEMFALQLLLRIDSHGRYSVSTHEMLGDLRSARNAILNHALVNFALECRSAYIDVNCAKFFKLVEKANYVQKCVLHKYFVKIRSKTLERFNQGMARGPFRIKELARIFRASETETEALCLHHGLSIVLHQEDGKCVEFRTTTFSHPSEDFETKKSPLVRTNNNHKYRQFIVRDDEIASEDKVSAPPVGQQLLQQQQQQQQQQQNPELTKKQKEAKELREKIQRVEAEQKRAKAAIEAKKAEEARLLLEEEKRKEEARAKAERERIEKERIEKEAALKRKQEEEERIRLEKERVEKERVEKEAAAKKLEKEIREREEQLERERQEQLERERQEQLERERQERERVRLEAERAEKLRLEEERKKREEARRQAELARKKAEEERKERERLEAIRLRRFQKNRKAILQLFLWRWRTRKDKRIALRKKQKALSMMATSPSTFSPPTYSTQQKPARVNDLCGKRKVELSIPKETKSVREEKDEAYVRKLVVQMATLVDVSSSFARPLDVPKILETTRAFVPGKGEARQTRIWKFVLCSGAEYEPPSVHRGTRSPNAVAVAAWLRAKLSKGTAITNKSSEEGTVLASYASKLSMREPFHWVIIKDVPGKSWTPRSQQDEEIEVQNYKEQVAGLSAGCFVLDCSSLYENPRTKMKEISRNEVHRLKRFAAVTKRGNAPLLVIAASSKDYDTHSSKKLIEKAFREAGLPSSTLIMRVDDAFVRFSSVASGGEESMMKKKDASFIEKIDRELENQVKRCGKAFTGVPHRVETSIVDMLENEYAPVATDFERKVLADSSNGQDVGENLSLTDFKIVVECFNKAIDNVKDKIRLCEEDEDFWPYVELSSAYTNKEKRTFFENVPDPLWRKDVPYLTDQLERAKLPQPPSDSLENNKNIYHTLFRYVSSLEDSEFTGAARRHLQRAGFDCVLTALSLCESRTLALHASTGDVKTYVQKERMHSFLSASSKKRTNEIGMSSMKKKKRGQSPLSYLSLKTQPMEYPSISLHFPITADKDDNSGGKEERFLHTIDHDGKDDALFDERAVEEDQEAEDAVRNLVRDEVAASNAFERSFVMPKKKPKLNDADAVTGFSEKLNEELDAERKLRALFS